MITFHLPSVDDTRSYHLKPDQFAAIRRRSVVREHIAPLLHLQIPLYPRNMGLLHCSGLRHRRVLIIRLLIS